MLSARILAASLALLLSSTVAHAGDSEAPGATAPDQDAPALDDATAERVMASLTQPETESHWYGGQLLLADAAGLTALTVLTNLDDHGRGGQAIGTLARGAVGSLALTPAIIHASHGNYAAAFGSVALRVGLPAAGLAIGAGACTDSTDWCLGPPLLGFAAGALTAILVDDLVLARESRTVTTGAPRFQVGIAPRADHGMTVSLGGAF
ncbi:MAG: hypothetical protein K8W52_31730 [Deltaproteobacteria bacterium]|nr:hypothetical protein [Deltaproteobacteria bacterium]